MNKIEYDYVVIEDCDYHPFHPWVCRVWGQAESQLGRLNPNLAGWIPTSQPPRSLVFHVNHHVYHDENRHEITIEAWQITMVFAQICSMVLEHLPTFVPNMAQFCRDLTLQTTRNRIVGAHWRSVQGKAAEPGGGGEVRRSNRRVKNGGCTLG